MEMDPVEVYKRYIKIKKPDIKVDGQFIHSIKNPEIKVLIEHDPDFRSIKRCIEFRRTRPEATLFLCSCNVCVKVLLYELYKIV
jgi:hypothetical protein